MIKYIYIVCEANNDTIYSVTHFMAYSIQRGEIYMKIIKRSGSEDIFDAAKIVAAIRKANDSVLDYEKLTADQIEEIASNVETAVRT